MKKIALFEILGIATLVLLGGNLAVASSFQDVSAGHANYDAIEYVKSNGIVSGYPNGDFKPDSTINRAEFTKIIVGAQFDAATIDGCIAKNIQVEWSYAFFPDVPKDAWFAKYICVAKMNDIVKGYPDGSFGPDKDINFSEASKIIVNAFGYKVSSDVIWYKPFVEQLGLKKAIPTTIAGLSVNITRGEMAEMVYRLKANISNKTSLTYQSLIEDIKTGKVTSATDSTITYSNSEFGLTFNYPNNWSITKNNTVNMGDNNMQLRLELKPITNSDVSLNIYTPLLETGYINFKTEKGFERAIEGLTLEKANLLRNNETSTLIAQNIYYKDINDFFTSLEFQYGASNGSSFDSFLPDYYKILDSVVFN